MSGTFQLIGTAVGGSFFGPIGAAVGGAVGGLVDQEVFGKILKGPRLDEFRTTGSAVGAPMIRGYGNNRVAGELMWFGRIRERKRTKTSGGIAGFGGQKTTTYEYYATFAIALMEGEVDCLRSIRINGKLWWQDPGYAGGNTNYLAQQASLVEFGPDSLTADELAEYNESALEVATSQGRNEYFTFYRGTSDQAVDPTIQSYLGAAAPAYRDTAYVVFNELPVTEYGGTLPNIEFEVVSGATTAADGVDFWASQQMYPWLTGQDPRHPENTHQYKYVKQAVSSDSEYVGSDWRNSLSAALADFETDTGFSASLPSELMGWSVRSDSEQYSWEMRPVEGAAMPDRQVLNLHFNDAQPDIGFFTELTAGGVDDTQNDCRAIDSVLGVDTGITVWWGDRTEFDVVETDGGGQIGLYYLSTSADSTEISPRGRNNNNCTSLTPNTTRLKVIPDVIIQVRRVPRCPDPLCEDKRPLPENPDYCLDEDNNVYPEVTYAEASGDFLQLVPYTTETTAGITYVTEYPVGPVVNLDYPDHASRNTEAWWTARYNEAVAAGTVDAGWSYDATGEGGAGTYPRVSTTACAADITVPGYCDAAAVLVSDIIETECLRRGLTASDFDTSLVTDTIWGYKLDRNVSGREAIEQLRTFSWLDGPEVDGVIRFVPRGLDSVATLTEDDLAAHEYNSQRPPAVEVTRVDDIQLPRTVRVGYSDQEADYQPGQQYDRRLVTDAVNTQDIQLGITMTGDRAKKIATIALYDQWAARKALSLSLGPKWLSLCPGDVVLVPDLDDYTRARIESDDLSIPGLRQLTLVRDEQSLYDREGAGPTPQVPDEDTNTAQGPTTAVILDLPPMSDADNDAGYYVAMYGTLDGWQSAVGYRSLDAGSTYEEVVEESGVIAGLVTVPYDGTDMTVQVYGGDLLSATTAAVAAGTNRFAAGANGRWVIGTFETVTDLGDGLYTLSDINAGLFDTSWVLQGSPTGFGEVGDAFVMLETVVRVSESDDIVGDTVIFRPVTAGTSFDNAPSVSFVARGNGRGFVTGFGTTTPPSHDDGATYVAGASATGEWAGYDNYIVHDVDDEWFFEQPLEGREVRAPNGDLYRYTAGSPGSWARISESGLQDGDAGDVEISGGGTVITITKGLAPYVRGAGWDSASADAIDAADCDEVNVFCPTAGTITRWTILTEGGTGSCEVDVWKRPYASGEPSVSNSIVGSGKPAVSSGTRGQSAPTGWTSTSVAASDVLTFKLDSSSTFTSLNIMLEITPS